MTAAEQCGGMAGRDIWEVKTNRRFAIPIQCLISDRVQGTTKNLSKHGCAGYPQPVPQSTFVTTRLMWLYQSSSRGCHTPDKEIARHSQPLPSDRCPVKRGAKKRRLKEQRGVDEWLVSEVYTLPAL